VAGGWKDREIGLGGGGVEVEEVEVEVVVVVVRELLCVVKTR